MAFKHKNYLDYFEFLEVSSAKGGNKRKAVIFHHSDNDGAFAAASIYRLLALDLREHMAGGITSDYLTIKPVQYGTFKDEDILELVDNDTDVFVVDFSFPEALCDKIAEKAGFFIILDHHKTSANILKDKPYAIFDMNASGARMAYVWANPDATEIPLAVVLADNRDLWNKIDGREDAFHAAILKHQSLMYELNDDNKPFWFINAISNMLDNDEATIFFCKEGESMIAVRNSNISSVCQDKNLYHTVIGGYPAVLVNYPIDQSDACEYLYSQDKYKDMIIGCFSFKRGQTNFSLRKHKSLDIDLGHIAELHYGGGGHPDASGFAVSMQRGVDILANKEKWALCWNAADVDDILESFEGNNKKIAEALKQLPATMHSRATCETDTSLLQILPYITVRDEYGCVFTYKRPTGGTETRLHAKYSLGLGGHVDTLPGVDGFSKHIGSEAARELQEEVGLDEKHLTFVSDEISWMFDEGDFTIIRLKTGEVEEVHLGLAFTVGINRDWLNSISEDEISVGKFVHENLLTQSLHGDVGGVWEKWSSYVIDVKNKAES